MSPTDDDRTQLIRRPPPVLAYLVQVNGYRAGDAHQLRDGFSAGRGSRNDLQLDDPTASDEHARIRVSEDGDFTLTDLAATNSLKVNGVETARSSLQDGDRIDLGETSFVFKRL